MKWSMVFPGQGSQSVGMLTDFSQTYPIILHYFEQASDVLSFDLWRLVSKGPLEQLNETRYTQPAMLVADCALWAVWCQQGGVTPEMMAGHSLGEYAALVASGSLDFEEAVSIVALRGKAMQEAVPLGQGAMAAIIGLEDSAVDQLCLDAAGTDVLSSANYNSKGQVVIAGHKAAVLRALDLAPSRGAKLAKEIAVSGPFHCSLMSKAADLLAEDLQQLNLQSTDVSVIHNVDVAVHKHEDKMREALFHQLTQPVRWVETINLMEERGVNVIVECGPGKVLSGLVKRINRQLSMFSLSTAQGFEDAMQHMEALCR